MRMKMFSAETFEAAKALIFAEMGEDAVILSEREVEGGVEVRAATDKLGGGMVPSAPVFMNEAARRAHSGHGLGTENPIFARVRDSLLWHGTPKHFAERVAASGAPMGSQIVKPEAGIEAGLAEFIHCDPVPVRLERDIVLVGPPGHGRTATAAKLTRRSAVSGAEILPVAADLDATAGGEQLAAYLEQEQGQIRVCPTPDNLFEVLRKTRAAGQRCIIDLPAIVPFDADDMASLKDLVAVIDAEPVLVMSAEGHPDDLAEAAKAFARTGVQRAIITKLDVVRRRGGIVSAIAGAKLSFSHLAVTPFIGGGLVPAAPSRLAHLLLEDAPAEIALRGAA